MRVLSYTACAFFLIVSLTACNQSPWAGANDDRVGDGIIEKDFDTNGDGRPDLAKFYKGNEVVRVERDRNFDGKPDLIQEYDHGVLAREIHDDDFDGKPETVKIFRKGVLAILERDPEERGAIDIAEYYDEHGKLIRREVRSK